MNVTLPSAPTTPTVGTAGGITLALNGLVFTGIIFGLGAYLLYYAEVRASQATDSAKDRNTGN